MPGAPTLITATNPFRPLCFAKGALDDLIMVNGLERGYRWDGKTATAELLGILAPAAAPSATTPVGGAATAGDYLLAFRYTDDEEPLPIPSNLSETLTVTAADNDKFDWTVNTTAAEDRAAFVELYRSTSGQATTLYLILTVPVRGAILTSNTNGGNVRFTVPEGHGLTAGCKITVSGHTVAGYNTTHTISSVTSNTVTTGTAYSADGTGGAWTFAGYTADDDDDDTIAENTALPILNPNGTPNANRFSVPPNWKAVCAWFQDRMFYGVDVTYNQGYIDLTNGSASASTTDGGWTTAMVGRYLYINGESRAYEILSVTPGAYPAATLTLDEAWTGVTASFAYAIRVKPEERNLIYFSEAQEPESVPDSNVLALQENTGDDDELVGMLPQGGYLMLVKNHHIYRMSFVRQPTIDVSITLAASRGALSHRTCIYVEGVAYIMDTQGIYRWDGSSAEPIEAVQDLFRNGNIDFTRREFFHCTKDPEKSIVRFHVALTSDLQEIKHAIAINYRSGAVWLENTPFPLASGCVANDSDGRQRALVGSLGEQIYTQGETLYDGVGVTGDVLSATSTTITKAAGTPFPATCLNASLGIVSGTGKGQIRRISTVATDTLTVSSAWDTTPDSTSKFRVGAIAWTYRTGLMAVAQKDEREEQRAVAFVYRPSNTALSMDIRLYVNHETSPRNRSQGPAAQVLGVTSIPGQPDAVVDLYTARSPLGNQIGYVELPMAGFYDDRTRSGVRWVAVELRGMGAESGFEIYEMILDGFV